MKIDVRSMAGVTAAALALAAAIAFGARAQSNDMPEGPAKAAVIDACASCHDTGTFTDERHSAADWAGIVTQMEGMGLSLTDDQRKAIVDYLTQNYAPGSSAAAPAPAAQ